MTLWEQTSSTVCQEVLTNALERAKILSDDQTILLQKLPMEVAQYADTIP